jgi:DNA-binding winged helix-turn-helix (wHTH) protein
VQFIKRRSLLIFGDYYLDVERRLLLDQHNNEIEIEDKALDVLLYLISARDRYVSLQELHDQVWAGRIVSDSAVRQTIAKLRKVLSDQAEQPTFIKSVAKKGYRFISSVDRATSDAPEPAIAQKLTTVPAETLTKQGFAGFIMAKKRWLWCLPGLIFLYLIFGRITVTAHLTLQSGKHLYVTTKDNKQFFYIEQLKDEHNYRLWVHTGGIDQIIDTQQFPLLFPQITAEQLTVGWQKEQTCGLNFYQLQNYANKQQLHVPNCTQLLHISKSGESLLLSYHKLLDNKVTTEVALLSKNNNDLKIIASIPEAVATLQALHDPASDELLLVSSNLNKTNIQLVKTGQLNTTTASQQWAIDSGGLRQIQQYAGSYYLLLADGVHRLKNGVISPVLEVTNAMDLVVIEPRLTLLKAQSVTRQELFSWSDDVASHTVSNKKESDIVLPHRTIRYLGNQISNAYIVRKYKFNYKVSHLSSNTELLSSATPIELLYFNEKTKSLIYLQEDLIVSFNVISKTVEYTVNIPGNLVWWDHARDLSSNNIHLAVLKNDGVEPYSFYYDQGILESIGKTVPYTNELSRGALQEDQIAFYLNKEKIDLPDDIGVIEQPILTDTGLYFIKSIGNKNALFFYDKKMKRLNKLSMSESPTRLIRHGPNSIFLFTRPTNNTQVEIAKIVI